LARPVICHQFVGDAAEQQSAGGIQLLDRQLLQFLAPDIQMPGYVAVRPLDEAIQRHQVPHDQLRHRASPQTDSDLQLVVSWGNWCNIASSFLNALTAVWNRT